MDAYARGDVHGCLCTRLVIYCAVLLLTRVVIYTVLLKTCAALLNVTNATEHMARPMPRITSALRHTLRSHVFKCP